MRFVTVGEPSPRWQPATASSWGPTRHPVQCEVCARFYRSTDLTDAVGSVLGPLDHNSRRTSRQVSRGTVWSVGGVVPGLAAVDNGRGQFVQSGTNARLFRTPCPTTKPRAVEEREKHEARIALALGM